MSATLLAWIRHTMWSYRTELAIIIVIQLVIALAMAMQPVLMQKLISLLLGDTSQLVTPALWLTGGMVVLVISVSLLQGFSGIIAAAFSSSLLRDLQVEFFCKSSRLTLAFFRQRSSGELFTRFNHDIGQVQSLLANSLPQAMKEFATFIAVTGVLFWACPPSLVLLTLLILAAGFFCALLGHRLISKYAVEQRISWQSLNDTFDDLVRGIETLKTLGAETWMAKDFDLRTSRLREQSLKAGRAIACISPSVDVIFRIGSMGLLMVAYLMIASDRLDISTFFLFFFCSALLQGTVSAMTSLVIAAPLQLVATRHLVDFYAQGEEPEERDPVVSLEKSGSLPIKIKDLEFAHPGGVELFAGLNADIPGNAITLLSGPNGSGKSTLINLILRFFQADAGDIEIAGRSISAYSRSSIRGSIGVVGQQHYLFNDTLRNNLLIARHDATDEELWRVLESVHLSEFSRQLRHGLDTQLTTERGGLSGGERQRLCLARMILRKSSILILDEPWSNLDEASGTALTDILRELRRQCTIIVVSHQYQLNGRDFDAEIRLGQDQYINKTEGRSRQRSGDSGLP